MVTPAFGGTNG
uniref:Uncharacterized protein n=1 Tax=Arundo donax TaxID=35708 RepID=A0A0A8ZKQ9_ARUDO